MFGSLRKPLRMHFTRTRGQGAKTVPTVFNTTQPGLLLIFVDQSASMQFHWPNHSGKKADEAANQVNLLISKILRQSMQGNTPRERIYLAIYGYSDLDGIAAHSVRLLAEGWPADFATNPDNNWIQPRSEGETPMALAFEAALEVLDQFFSFPDNRERFQESAPPVIINITDGKANEFAKPATRKQIADSILALQSFESPQGFSPLIFQVQIADGVERRVFPLSSEGLDDFGRLLFQFASKIPDSWVAEETKRRKTEATRRDRDPIEMGSVGLVVGAGPQELMDLLDFASRPTNIG